MLLHESPIMYDYTCPEGSIVLFTEVSQVYMYRLRFRWCLLIGLIYICGGRR